MDEDVTTFSGLARDVWPLPPRGISIAKTNHRAGEVIQYTYLCDRNPECKAVAYSMQSEEHARGQVSGHICPEIDGSRGLIPTGKTLIQKMWDEGDDAMDAYRGGRTFKGMDGDQLKGFIRGIAEVLTFCTVPCFKVTDDVLKELYRRWKMRDGQIPFAPTPSYNYHPYLDEARAKAISSEVKSTVKPTKATPTKRQPARKPEAVVELMSAQRQMIRESYHSGNFDEHALAQMFGISAERVLSIAGPKPTVQTSDVIMPGLF